MVLSSYGFQATRRSLVPFVEQKSWRLTDIRVGRGFSVLFPSSPGWANKINENRKIKKYIISPYMIQFCWQKHFIYWFFFHIMLVRLLLMVGVGKKKNWTEPSQTEPINQNWFKPNQSLFQTIRLNISLTRIVRF